MSNPLPEVFTIRDDFPAVDYEKWRAVVEESLKGAPFEKKLVTHTYEGIDLQPIYVRASAGAADAAGFPGISPFVRGARPLGSATNGWDLRQEHAHPDLRATNEAILADLAGGVTSILLRLDAAAANGFDPDQDGAAELAGHDGLMAYCLDDLDQALAGVQLPLVGVALDAGAAFAPAAMMLTALWRRRDVAPQDARGAFNADPFAFLARHGRLPVTAAAALAALAELSKWAAATYPSVTAVGVDTSPYHDAGATAAQDIAFALATGVAYLRAMTDAGMAIDDAARQIQFRMGVGTHHFLALAKLRAARRAWARVIEACGGQQDAGAMSIHARTSNRVLTQRDPYVNLLRNTVALFAAGLGGANALTSVPFDALTRLPDAFSRRIARNTVLVLQEESHLNRVIDPAGGSWCLEQLTNQLADTSWQVFQEIERHGGMLAAFESQWVATQIDAAYAPRAKDIAIRKEGITGVSEFPNVTETRVAAPPLDSAAMTAAATARLANTRRDTAAFAELNPNGLSTEQLAQAAAAGATLGQMASSLGFHAGTATHCAALEPRSFAEPFEELRDASDVWQQKHGRRPRVFLANLGPVAHHTARATYSKNFFEAGGFEVITNDGFADAESAAAAFAQSGARIAVICSSDKLYPEIVPSAAARLKEAGARTVVLAGFPRDNATPWRAAGVDRFIFIKCDVLQTLRELLEEEGVLTEG